MPNTENKNLRRANNGVFVLHVFYFAGILYAYLFLGILHVCFYLEQPISMIGHCHSSGQGLIFT
jgi:hypothetical protein